MMKFLLVAAISAVLVMSAMSASVSEEELEYNLMTDFKHFIDHFGHDAVAFIKCMGPSVTHCAKPLMKCVTAVAATHNVIGCIGALKCEGKDAKDCIHHLHDKSATTKHA